MKKMKLQLCGTWHKITHEEAQNAKVGMLFFDYIKDKRDGFSFYGITSHNANDSFSYFIGVECDKPNLCVDLAYYELDDENMFPAIEYENLIHSDLSFAELFDSSNKFSLIPTKIEEYIIKGDHLKVKRIIVPVVDK